jgi:uncharacterized protein (DUF1330 family)
MPRGYFFGEFEITDPAAYEVYRTKVPDIISAHGGRILVRGGDPHPFDGTMPQRRFVIVEFDSPEAARTFYYSEAISGGAAVPVKRQHQQWFRGTADRSGVGYPVLECRIRSYVKCPHPS